MSSSETDVQPDQQTLANSIVIKKRKNLLLRFDAGDFDILKPKARKSLHWVKELAPLLLENIDVSEILIARETNTDGARQFAICPLTTIFSMQLFSTCHFHEIIKGSNPVKLYFELDLNDKDLAQTTVTTTTTVVGGTRNEISNQLVQALTEYVSTALLDFQFITTAENLHHRTILLDSSSDVKLSLHVIFPELAFNCMRSLATFVEHVEALIMADELKIWKSNSSHADISDFLGRSAFTYKHCDPDINISSIIDMQPYNCSNQQLRIWMSSKFGQNRPFKCQEMEYSLESFTESLVSVVSPTQDLLELSTQSTVNSEDEATSPYVYRTAGTQEFRTDPVKWIIRYFAQDLGKKVTQHY
jgi:hypothetical protein